MAERPYQKHLKNMLVYALVGKSGTGKSFHAMDLIRKLDIEGIIDDGLFIYKNSVIEGISAKKMSTKIGAIKTALFFDETHKELVKKAIKEKAPRSMLILATSNKMADEIAETLDLPKPRRKIQIEEITTAEEREIAHLEREKYGKHVIPAPSLQLKRNFAGYFMDPLRFFRGREVGAASERTVVRPPFSYAGDYIIEERVIDDIVECAAIKNPGISKVTKKNHYTNPEAYNLDLAIKVNYGFPIWETAQDFQKEVHDMVELMTAFNVVKVDVEVKDIDDQKK